MLRSRNFIVLAVSGGLSLFGLYRSVVRQDAHDKGQVHSRWPEIMPSLECSLEIAASLDNETEYPSDIVDMVVSEDGAIRILDKSQNKLFAFDPQGRFISSFGRQGQGPGEFQTPTKLFLDSGNNLYIRDGRRIHCYREDGQFLKSIRFDFLTVDFFLDGYHTFSFAVFPGGKIYACVVNLGPNGTPPANLLIRTDELGRGIEVLDSLSGKNIKCLGGGVLGGLFSLQSPRILMGASAQANLLVYGNTAKRELNVIDIKTGAAQTIRPFGGKASSNDPLYSKVLIDEKGDIWVEIIGHENPLKTYNIYNARKKQWYHCVLPISPHCVFKNKAYTIIYDEFSGRTKVQRWDLVNPIP